MFVPIPLARPENQADALNFFKAIWQAVDSQICVDRVFLDNRDRPCWQVESHYVLKENIVVKPTHHDPKVHNFKTFFNDLYRVVDYSGVHEPHSNIVSFSIKVRESPYALSILEKLSDEATYNKVCECINVVSIQNIVWLRQNRFPANKDKLITLLSMYANEVLVMKEDMEEIEGNSAKQRTPINDVLITETPLTPTSCYQDEQGNTADLSKEKKLLNVTEYHYPDSAGKHYMAFYTVSYKAKPEQINRMKNRENIPTETSDRKKTESSQPKPASPGSYRVFGANGLNEPPYNSMSHDFNLLGSNMNFMPPLDFRKLHNPLPALYSAPYHDLNSQIGPKYHSLRYPYMVDALNPIHQNPYLLPPTLPPKPPTPFFHSTNVFSTPQGFLDNPLTPKYHPQYAPSVNHQYKSPSSMTHQKQKVANNQQFLPKSNPFATTSNYPQNMADPFKVDNQGVITIENPAWTAHINHMQQDPQKARLEKENVTPNVPQDKASSPKVDNEKTTFNFNSTRKADNVVGGCIPKTTQTSIAQNENLEKEVTANLSENINKMLISDKSAPKVFANDISSESSSSDYYLHSSDYDLCDG